MIGHRIQLVKPKAMHGYRYRHTHADTYISIYTYMIYIYIYSIYIYIYEHIQVYACICNIIIYLTSIKLHTLQQNLGPKRPAVATQATCVSCGLHARLGATVAQREKRHGQQGPQHQPIIEAVELHHQGHGGHGENI